MIMGMFRSTPDLDDVDLDLHLATARKRNPVRAVGRVVTFPFRAVAAVVGGIVGIVVLLLSIVLFPIRLAIGLIRRLVGLAADIVFAIWRVAMWAVGLVLGVFKLIFKLLDATIGNAIRLVFKIVFGTLKLILKIVTLGRFGRSAAAAAAGATVASRVSESDA